MLVEPNWRQRLPTKRRIQPGSTHLDYLPAWQSTGSRGWFDLDSWRIYFNTPEVRESKEKTMLPAALDLMPRLHEVLCNFSVV